MAWVLTFTEVRLSYKLDFFHHRFEDVMSKIYFEMNHLETVQKIKYYEKICVIFSKMANDKNIEIVKSRWR